MITGGTTPLGGATKARFQKRSVPQPPKNGWLASRSMALILPTIRRVASPKRWLMYSEVATTSSLATQRKQAARVHRQERPAAEARQVAAPIGDMGVQAAALPEAELAGVGVDHQVDTAAEVPLVVARALQQVLVEAGRPEVEARCRAGRARRESRPNHCRACRGSAAIGAAPHRPLAARLPAVAQPGPWPGPTPKRPKRALRRSAAATRWHHPRCEHGCRSLVTLSRRRRRVARGGCLQLA